MLKVIKKSVVVAGYAAAVDGGGEVRVFCFSCAHLLRLIRQLYLVCMWLCVSTNVTVFLILILQLLSMFSMFHKYFSYFFFSGYLQMTRSVLYALVWVYLHHILTDFHIHSSNVTRRGWNYL